MTHFTESEMHLIRWYDDMFDRAKRCGIKLELLTEREVRQFFSANPTGCHDHTRCHTVTI